VAKTASSRRWLREHFTDPYVQQAKKAGWRSRASYKLLEIDTRHPIFKSGQIVIDLGAAPGGWSQVAAKKVGTKGRVIAVDLLSMETLPEVQFIQGDYLDPVIIASVHERLQGQLAHIVLSDMAPNTTGIKAVDQARVMGLAEEVLDGLGALLRPGGDLLIKVFQGEGFDAYLKTLRNAFKKVVICKPSASRDRSAEVYILARQYCLSSNGL
jgi:23S rRNA (uridine2552-2'-O)-methyltransferase